MISATFPVSDPPADGAPAAAAAIGDAATLADRVGAGVTPAGLGRSGPFGLVVAPVFDDDGVAPFPAPPQTPRARAWRAAWSAAPKSGVYCSTSGGIPLAALCSSLAEYLHGAIDPVFRYVLKSVLKAGAADAGATPTRPHRTRTVEHFRRPLIARICRLMLDDEGLLLTRSAPPAPLADAVPTPAKSVAGPRLLVGLILACAYAAFAQGATSLPQETRLQVLVAGLTLAGLVAWLGTHSHRPLASGTALVGVGLLGAFAVWCGLSVLWSVSPADTWIEVNRSIDYALVAALALAAASRVTAPAELAARGVLAVAVAVALYALGGKVIPWVHVPGVFDLNQTAIFSRLRAPLDYWNALGLLCVIGVPLALRLSTDVTRQPNARVRSLAALSILLTVLGMTYSRGGVLALVAAVIATTCLGGPRLRGLLAFAIAAIAAVPPLAFAFGRDSLTRDGVGLHDRVVPGLELGLLIVLCLLALAYAGRRLIATEAYVPEDPIRTARVWRALRRAALVLVGLLLIALIVSSRGLFGQISHQVDLFTQTKVVPVSDPARLLSTNSGNRWVWWKEAAGAFSARPLGGWGAGSFQVTHLLYRKAPPLPVLQPHNVPLQLLAEDGLIGALLALGGVAALITAAVRRIRRAAPGREQALAGACLAAAIAWLVHGVFDWDWDIPGVTLPALVLLAVAAAAAKPLRPPPARPPAHRTLTAGRVALAGLTLGLAAISASAILPALSQSKADESLQQAADASTPAQLQQAAATADLAARLNPLDDTPLIDAAIIADRRDLPLIERTYLLRATARAPYDAAPWVRLAYVATELDDRTGLLAASNRALALDPLGTPSLGLAITAEAFIALPQDSATATGTPLAP
jgi:O-Antigen ligase